MCVRCWMTCRRHRRPEEVKRQSSVQAGRHTAGDSHKNHGKKAHRAGKRRLSGPRDGTGGRHHPPWDPRRQPPARQPCPDWNSAGGSPHQGSPCQPRGTATPAPPRASWLTEPSGKRAGRPCCAQAVGRAESARPWGPPSAPAAAKPHLSIVAHEAGVSLPKPAFQKRTLNVSRPVTLRQLLRGRRAPRPGRPSCARVPAPRPRHAHPCSAGRGSPARPQRAGPGKASTPRGRGAPRTEAPPAAPAECRLQAPAGHVPAASFCGTAGWTGVCAAAGLRSWTASWGASSCGRAQQTASSAEWPPDLQSYLI